VETAKYDGWAVIEMFGHSREAGYVTTEYFGTGALFRVDVPELSEREVELTRPEWINGQLAGKGSKVLRSGVQGRTRFIGPGAVYAMNPCSQEAVMKVIEAMSQRDVKVVELVTEKQLVSTLPGEPDDEEDDPYEDDQNS
jgi:hypothetical protein